MTTTNDALRAALEDGMRDLERVRDHLPTMEAKCAVDRMLRAIAASNPEPQKPRVWNCTFEHIRDIGVVVTSEASKPEPQAQATNEHTEHSERTELIKLICAFAVAFSHKQDAVADMYMAKIRFMLAADKAGGEVAGYVLVNKESREGVMSRSHAQGGGMSPDKIKYGLEQYSRLSLYPQQAMTVHVDERGHQTALPWHVVASNALKYVELMEELCMAAKEEPMGKLFLRITGRNYELEKENNALTHWNKRQAEMIRELQDANP